MAAHSTANLKKSLKIPHQTALRAGAHCPTVSATLVSVASYQNQWGPSREMLLTVEVWQVVLSQGRQAGHGPQALVGAAHLTHGGVAHGARHAESIPSTTQMNVRWCI